MKRILSTALAIVLFVGASQAQTTNEKGRHHRGENKEQALNTLNLTADQKAKMQSLREAQRNEIENLKKNGNVTPEQRKAIHEKYRAQYQAILTPAQQEELKKKKEEWKDKGNREGKGAKGQGFGRRGGDFGAQAAFFKKELNLTGDQESKLRNIFQEFRNKAQDVRSNNNLSQEQKRSQFQTLAQQYMAQGRAVLSAEQSRKLDELLSKRKGKRSSNV